MPIVSLRASQLSSAGLDWYTRYLEAVDRGDTEAVRPYLHPECVLQINNDLPIYGVNAILVVLERYYSGFRSLQHEFLNIYGDDNNFATEMLCHYVRHDGVQITIPAVSFVDRGHSGQLLSARLYANTTPVFTRTS